MVMAFDGDIDVHYRFIHLCAPGADVELAIPTGQVNGICLASSQHLSFLTGLHSGSVRFAVEWLEAEPPLDESWEEIVEVPFDVPQRDLVLSAFEDSRVVTLPSSGPHRARLNAHGMQEGRDLDTAWPQRLGPDRYLLQLWPAAPSRDAVVRETSDFAMRLHQHARRHDEA